MKQIIKLTEQDLHRIVNESVRRVLNEIGDTERGQYALGAVAARNDSRMRNAYRQGAYDSARKYGAVSDNANAIANRQSSSYGIDQGSPEYDRRKDLYNAKMRGYRNYQSTMNNNDTDYRTAPQTKQELQQSR